MRIATLSLDFGLLLLVLVALIHTQGTTAVPKTGCDKDCVTSEKCEYPMGRGVCGKSGETCCSILKPEFRTACIHHGGACLNSCNSALVRSANDCPPNKQCCVLI